jgi:hypothetical protein
MEPSKSSADDISRPIARDLPSILGAVAATLDQIDSGELLAALPGCAAARQRHLIALRMIDQMRGEVNDLCVRLKETAQTDTNSPNHISR